MQTTGKTSAQRAKLPLSEQMQECLAPERLAVSVREKSERDLYPHTHSPNSLRTCSADSKADSSRDEQNLRAHEIILSPVFWTEHESLIG